MSATNIWTQGNREHGAEMYIKALEVPLKQIVTLGDMSSDVLMFRNSGVRIAMGNASADAQREAISSRPRKRMRASPTRWKDRLLAARATAELLGKFKTTLKL